MFGFQDEAAAFVEVNAAFAGGAVGVVLGDFVFEAVTGVAGGVGMRDGQEIAEFGKEKLAVGAFGGTGFGPAGDERIGGVNRHCGEC